MWRMSVTLIIVAAVAAIVSASITTLLPRAVPVAAMLGSGTSVPSEVNHQGVVQVNGVRFTGSGQFRFAIINTGSGLNLWTNDDTQVGTSNAPTAAVTLTVTDGVYNVALGDTALTNMTAIPASVFTNSSTSLRIWFNDGVNGNQQLAPDQKLRSAPYAFRAETVTSDAIGSTELASQAASLAKVSGGAASSDGSNVTVTGDLGAATITVTGNASAASATITGNVAAATATLTEQASTPSTPASGKGTIYEDTSKNVFLLASDGSKKYLNVKYNIAEQVTTISGQSTTPTNIPETDISVTAGTYLLMAHFWARGWVSNSPAEPMADVYGQIYNATDSVNIKDTRVGGNTYCSVDGQWNFSFDLFTVATFTGTKTIRLRGWINTNGTQFASGFRNDSSGASDSCRLLAIKLAE